MFGLYPNSYKQILSIFQKHENIEKVIIYGSRAKGNYREGSDIDLTILGNLNYDELFGDYSLDKNDSTGKSWDLGTRNLEADLSNFYFINNIDDKSKFYHSFVHIYKHNLYVLQGSHTKALAFLHLLLQHFQHQSLHIHLL